MIRVFCALWGFLRQSETSTSWVSFHTRKIKIRSCPCSLIFYRTAARIPTPELSLFTMYAQHFDRLHHSAPATPEPPEMCPNLEPAWHWSMEEMSQEEEHPVHCLQQQQSKHVIGCHHQKSHRRSEKGLEKQLPTGRATRWSGFQWQLWGPTTRQTPCQAVVHSCQGWLGGMKKEKSQAAQSKRL